MNKGGNPDWGKPLLPIPSLVTEFDIQVARLGLKTTQYVGSRELKLWYHRNRNRVYVPEWLLAEWGMQVEMNFTAA